MEQLPKYLEAEVHLFTTRCALNECEMLGPLLYGPYKILQQYSKVHCGHNEPLPASACFHRLAIKQKKHRDKYFYATKDSELSDNLRKLPGIPLLFLSHHAITLETPSDKSQRKANNLLQERLAPSQNELARLTELKREKFGEEPAMKKKKRKGPKGVNPLSCKKKQKKTVQTAGDNDAQSTKRKRIRKRNRSKIPDM